MQRRKAVHQARVRRQRQVAWSVVGVMLLVATAFALSYSPLFALDRVRIQGVEGEQADEVNSASDVDAGERLLSVDLRAVERRVAGLAWVRSVDVVRLPPSTVEVRVMPRAPVATVAVSSGQWSVDGEGVVVAGGPAEGTVVVHAPDSVLPPAGEVVSDAAVQAAIRVHVGLPPNLQAMVRGYEARSARGLELRLATEEAEEDGVVVVRFGDAERIDLKAQVILALLERARAQAALAGSGELGIAEIDVRAPDNPVLIPSG